MGLRKAAVRDRLVNPSALEACFFLGTSFSSSIVKGSVADQSSLSWGRIGKWGTIVGGSCTMTTVVGTGSTRVSGAYKQYNKDDTDGATATELITGTSYTLYESPGVNQSFANTASFTFLPTANLRFTADIATNDVMFNYRLDAASTLVAGNFFDDHDDIELGLLYLSDGATINRKFGIEGRHGGTIRSSVVWNPANSIGSAVITTNSGDNDIYAGASGSMRVIRQNINGTSTSGDAAIYMVALDKDESDGGTKEFIHHPFIYRSGASGLVGFCGGLSSWTAEDFATDSGTAGVDKHITPVGVASTTSCLDQLGLKCRTLVIELGINGTMTAAQLKSIIEKFNSNKTSTGDLVVLLVVHYVIPAGDAAAIAKNASNRAVMEQVANEGTASVPSSHIDYIDHYELMGSQDLDDYDADWEQAGGGIHPSIEGADGIAALEWAEISAPLEGGTAPRSRDFRARGWGVR